MKAVLASVDYRIQLGDDDENIEGSLKQRIRIKAQGDLDYFVTAYKPDRVYPESPATIWNRPIETGGHTYGETNTMQMAPR